jgi:hypothetical protein
MDFARNFHPEWGYLAPAPGFIIRTVRTALVATAVGVVGGAVTVLSLLEHPVADASQSVAARTLARTPDTGWIPAVVLRTAPVVAQAANQQAGRPAAAENDKSLGPIEPTMVTQRPTGIGVPAVTSPASRVGQTRLATSAEHKNLAGRTGAEKKTTKKQSGSRSASSGNPIRIFGDYGSADHAYAASGEGYRDERWGGLFPEFFSVR